jgi:hypothetical protein
MMPAILTYAAVAALVLVACEVEIRRAPARERSAPDAADRLILHLVAVAAALLWPAALPVLVRAAVRRLRPRKRIARLHARIARRLPHRRPRLAG